MIYEMVFVFRNIGMILKSRKNMNTPVLKRPNNYISHDRLNFKRSGLRIFSDRRDEVYDVTSMPHCGRRLGAIQRRSSVGMCIGDPANTGCCSNVVLKTEGGSTSRVYQDGIVYNDARTTTIHLQCDTQVLTLMKSTHRCSVT